MHIVVYSLNISFGMMGLLIQENGDFDKTMYPQMALREYMFGAERYTSRRPCVPSGGGGILLAED